MFPSLPPTQEVVDIFANTMKILEGQNVVLSQLVQNVIHNRYQGLSQTSLSDSLSQAISESIMEQVYLFNLLMNHEAQKSIEPRCQSATPRFTHATVSTSYGP
jgi:hypothetical protein